MRENGYYWVQFGPDVNNDNDPSLEDGWEVAYFNKDDGWYSIWDGGAYSDEELFEINEVKLKPNETQIRKS